MGYDTVYCQTLLPSFRRKVVHDIANRISNFRRHKILNVVKNLGVVWYCTCTGSILFVSFDVVSIVSHVSAPSVTFHARYDGGKVKVCVYARKISHILEKGCKHIRDANSPCRLNFMRWRIIFIDN